jgi:serine protease Do
MTSIRYASPLLKINAKGPAPKVRAQPPSATPGSRLGVSVLDLTATQQACLRPGDIVLALDNADKAAALITRRSRGSGNPC